MISKVMMPILVKIYLSKIIGLIKIKNDFESYDAKISDQKYFKTYEPILVKIYWSKIIGLIKIKNDFESYDSKISDQKYL